MDPTILAGMVDRGLSGRAIASEAGVSLATVRYWLSRHSLRTAKNPYNRRTASGLPICALCGESNPANFYMKRGRCKKCHNVAQVAHARTAKLMAIKHKGGQCERCGYSRNAASLDFHHLDPAKKDLNYKTSKHWSWDRLRAELDQCVLLCKNCHGEEHYPGCTL